MTLTPAALEEVFSHLRVQIDAAITDHLSRTLNAFQGEHASDAEPFIAAIEESLVGGKRFRALSAVIGAAATADSTKPGRASLESLLLAAATPRNLALGAALEFYQAAALIHDDIVDRADERRGRLSFHRALENHHQSQTWVGDSEHFGSAAALLAGDLMLAAAADTLEEAATGDSGTSLRKRFEQMTGEVALGQYLELQAANVPLTQVSADKSRIIDIVRLKSARYSVAHPVALGSTQAGGTRELAQQLEEAFEPAGVAFQLRDDDLGVFGDTEAIGKSSSGDVLEKKRTVLLATTFAASPKAGKEALSIIYGSLEPPTDSDVSTVRQLMRTYGRSRHESQISHFREEAEHKLSQASLSDQAKDICSAFMDLLVDRQK